MGHYIDAHKLWNDRPQIPEGKSQEYMAGFSECMCGFSILIREHIDNTAAHVEQRREAEWKYGNENGQYGYYCTICKAGFVGVNAEWIAKEHKYCPKCGAKMKGGA